MVPMFVRPVAVCAGVAKHLGPRPEHVAGDVLDVFAGCLPCAPLLRLAAQYLPRPFRVGARPDHARRATSPPMSCAVFALLRCDLVRMSLPVRLRGGASRGADSFAKLREPLGSEVFSARAAVGLQAEASIARLRELRLWPVRLAPAAPLLPFWCAFPRVGCAAVQSLSVARPVVRVLARLAVGVSPVRGPRLFAELRQRLRYQALRARLRVFHRPSR